MTTEDQQPTGFPYFLFGLVGIAAGIFITGAVVLLPIVSDTALPTWLAILNGMVAILMLFGGIGVFLRTNVGRILLMAAFGGFILLSVVSAAASGFSGSLQSWFSRAFGIVVAAGVIVLLTVARDRFN